MADYYPLIARAIEGLNDKSPTVRRAVYDRARQALVTQLQALDPPVSTADIERERASLDLAIGSVEAKYVLPAQQTAVEVNLPHEPSQTLLEPIDKTEDAEPPQQEAAGQADDEAEESASDVKPPEPVEEMEAEAEEKKEESDSVADVPVDAGPERPRISSKHHSSGQANRVRAIILVASILVVVVSIACWKLYNRELQNEVPALTEQTGEATDSASSETGKYTERLGGEVAPAPTAETASGALPTVAVQQSILFETDPSTANLPMSQQKVNASAGVVQWRLDQMDAGAGRPLETVVRADVDFPQIGLKLNMVLRKNTDGSAYSHIFELMFSQSENTTGHDVIGAAILQAKDTKEELHGTPLIGMMMPVTTNAFMIGLSDISSETERNIQLLQEKSWFDLNITFADGRQGKISIEKGPTGFQTISEAFRLW